MFLTILYIFGVLIVASLILYFVNTAPDAILDPIFKWVIRAIVIIVAVVLVLWMVFGLLGGGAVGMHLPGPCR